MPSRRRSGQSSSGSGSCNNNKDGDEGVMQKWIMRIEGAGKAEGASLTFLPKLQRCCTVLSSISGGRFLDDERLVRMYIQLASMSPDPIKVFTRAKQMRVGLRQSHFWCAWSEVVQDRGDCQTALSLLEEGGKYGCQPEILVNVMKAKLGYREWESRAIGSLLYRFPDEFLRVDVLRLLGQGSHVRVYACRLTSTGEELAIKVERPAVGLGWEFYVMLQIHRRLKSVRKLGHLNEAALKKTKRYLKPLLRPRQVNAASEKIFQYRDGWAMPMPQGRNGTLHDLINAYRKKNGTLIPEVLAAHYGAEMANALRLVPACDILHCDIKSDNWLMMDDSEDDSFGCARSVVLIDFGRSIDLRSSITECSASLDSVAYLQQSQNDDNDAPANSYCCVNKEFACIEMLEGRPWKHQVDLYGLACTIHFMLFGEYLKPQKNADVTSRKNSEGGRTESPDGRQHNCKWVPTSKFRRYWDTAMWKSVFDILINSPGYATTGTSCVMESMSLLKKVETLLRQHTCTPDRVSHLEHRIKKQEHMLYGI